jgi:hypothetical protein
VIHRQFLAAQLALIAWREAHQYGGHRAMTMVAHAVANRFRKHWGTWEWIFDNHSKFSAKNADELTVGWPHPMDVAWSRLLSEVDGILEGTSPDPTNPNRTPDGGAVYWGDLNGITREWFQTNILGKPEEHKRVASNATLNFWT